MFERLGGAFKTRRKSKKQGGWSPIVPVPEKAPAPPASHYKFGEHSAEYSYYGPDGRLWGFVRRYDTGSGEKEFWPLTFCERAGTKDREWRPKSFDVPRPLYGLDRISADRDASVCVCEGEKAADAVEQLLPGLIGITSIGGSNAAGKTDWGPLAGRRVVVWPDADPPGKDYAARVGQALTGIGAKSVMIITPPDNVKLGWDAADALAENWDMARVQNLINEARAPVEVLPAESSGVRQRQKEKILELIEEIELWHQADRRGFVTVGINNHLENMLVNSREFGNWLTVAHHTVHGGALGGQTLKDCIRLTEAQAIYNGPEYKTLFRVGQQDGAVYIDLGGADWRSVKVTAEGWEVIDQAPIKFLRSPHMRPLPVPERGGSVDQLRDLINFGTEANFYMIVAWLVGALNPTGPYPILVIGGEQGSAKSSLARALRSLVDPNATLTRTAPRDERDLYIGAMNAWVLSYDNLSGIPAWLSDGLCRMSTGGGFGTRQLYGDFEEVVFEGQRPVILNGIGDLAARPDLADRAITITLPPIPDEKRLTEKEWQRKFDEAAPEIFGAILEGISSALRRSDEVTLESKPRMADFAELITAAEQGLGWPDGSFLPLYAANRDEAVQASLEADPLALAIIEFMEEKSQWEGPAGQLLNELGELVSDKVKNAKWWPSTPAMLSKQLERAAPILRIHGIEFERRKGGASSSRTIYLWRVLQKKV